MNAVAAISWRDFKSFFGSFRGAAILSAFLCLTGVLFSSFVYSFMEMQSQAAASGGQGATLDQLLKGLFYNMHFILIFFVPAVTMSTFAEERRNHTIRLLQTSPVLPLQIVLGKFFAATGMMFVVLLCASVYPVFCLMYGNPDKGILATSYLGLFLMVSSNVAFGLWISSMTKNQLMAFLFTLVGLFVLLILSWIAPSISGGGSLEAVFKYLATTTHLDNLFKGLVSVSSIAYFLCFTSLFLFFTNAVIDSLRWR